VLESNIPSFSKAKLKIDSSRITQLEELISDVQRNVSLYEERVKDLSKEVKDINSNDKETLSNNEIQYLKRKIRELGQSTTKMCRSLQDGMTEVQSTSLCLYEWGTKVHYAIGRIAEKSGLSFNPCPNVPVSQSHLHSDI